MLPRMPPHHPVPDPAAVYPKITERRSLPDAHRVPGSPA
jgi:hypothetical protein